MNDLPLDNQPHPSLAFKKLRFMGSQPHPLSCTYQASIRLIRLEAGDGLALLEPGALFPQKLLGW